MAETATRERELLTTDEVSAITGIASPTLESWRCRRIGGPPFIKLSKGMIRYRRADLDAWLNRNLVTPTAQ